MASTGEATRFTSALRISAAASCAAATALALWLVWPRRPRAGRDETLLALGRLRAELVAVYADIVSTINRVGLPHEITKQIESQPAGPDEHGVAGNSDSQADKLKQAIEQSLILEAALAESASRAAAELFPGANAEDLEAEFSRREDPEIQTGKEVIRSMHSECVRGRLPEHLPEAESAATIWGAEDALATLRALGQAKAAALKALKHKSQCWDGVGESGAVAAMQACGIAEDATWVKLWPSDHEHRRRCFPTALEQMSMSNRGGFRKRREAVECELSALAKAC